MFHRISLYQVPPVTVTIEVTFGEAAGTTASEAAGVAAAVAGQLVPLVRKSTALELPDMVSLRPKPLK